MRRRFVAQLSVVTGDPELLNQAKLGQQFRFTENDFGKNLFVKQVQTPRPKPDQVDQKNRERDYRQEEDGKEPLQNALKHGIDMEPRNPRPVKSKVCPYEARAFGTYLTRPSLTRCARKLSVSPRIGLHSCQNAVG